LHFEFISYLERRLLWLRRFEGISTKHAGADSCSNADRHEAQKDGLDSNPLRMHGFLLGAEKKCTDDECG
jgi:hypothetical protein